MEYQIACVFENSSNGFSGHALAELERRVNFLMDRGWKPHGGVSISVAPPHSHPNVDYKVYVAQALVREN